jgi:IPT/TIG domain/PASTA domain
VHKAVGLPAFVAAVAAVAATLIICATVQAAPITIGQIAAANPPAECDGGPTDLLAEGAGAATYTVPEDGIITSWSTMAASGAGQTLELKVFRPAGGPDFLVVGHDGPVTLMPNALDTFPAGIPVEAGDRIGLNFHDPTPARVACDFATGAEGDVIAARSGDTADGVIVPLMGAMGDARPNVAATFLPAPTITSLGPSSGSVSGGTSVAITGTDFEGASAVGFGPLPAASFTVDSEGQITAVAPAGTAGSVPVTVTTIAGTTTSSQQFTYQTPPAPIVPAPTCTVPKLRGKSLKASKTKIKGADCKVGKVMKKKGTKAATGKVVGQSKKPGTVLAAGAVVKVTLGKG